MDHQQRQRSTRDNAPGPGIGSGSGGASSSGRRKGGGAKGGSKKPIKVVYISNPMRVKTSAARFRSLVQELTGRDADPSKYSPEELDGDGAAAAADIDGAAEAGLSPGGAATSPDAVVVSSPNAAADHQPDGAAAPQQGGDYEEDEDGFGSQLLENNYALFSPPTLFYDHHPHSKFPFS